MSVTLINAEKQARYRERDFGVDGEKVRVGLNLNAATKAKMVDLDATMVIQYPLSQGRKNANENKITITPAITV